jgi:hypothetical protein
MDLMRSMLRTNGSEVGSRALAGGLGVSFVPSEVSPDAVATKPLSPFTDASEGRDARA